RRRQSYAEDLPAKLGFARPERTRYVERNERRKHDRAWRMLEHRPEAAGPAWPLAVAPAFRPSELDNPLRACAVARTSPPDQGPHRIRWAVRPSPRDVR